jgi:hypothetical protein
MIVERSLGVVIMFIYNAVNNEYVEDMERVGYLPRVIAQYRLVSGNLKWKCSGHHGSYDTAQECLDAVSLQDQYDLLNSEDYLI